MHSPERQLWCEVLFRAYADFFKYHKLLYYSLYGPAKYIKMWVEDTSDKVGSFEWVVYSAFRERSEGVIQRFREIMSQEIPLPNLNGDKERTAELVKLEEEISLQYEEEFKADFLRKPKSKVKKFF